ncbi:hypothetical protein CU042_11700 [Corynebacterium striatum]|nr:hypothetical protein [Corynebacterium striatum]
MKNEKTEDPTTGEKILQFLGDAYQNYQQRKQDEAWAAYQETFNKGVMRGAVLAAKAMLDGKIAEDKIEFLISRQWKLVPFDTQRIIEDARIELQKDAENREFRKKNPIRVRIVPKDQQEDYEDY